MTDGCRGREFRHARVRQAERHELADAVVGDVPADRTGAFGQQFHDPQIGQRIDLQPAQRARDDHAVEPSREHLREQGGGMRCSRSISCWSRAALAQRGRRLHQWLRVDIDGSRVSSTDVSIAFLPLPFLSPSLNAVGLPMSRFALWAALAAGLTAGWCVPEVFHFAPGRAS